ncbi:DUF1835 domain-containing protein [Bacillaceae bacterium SIJ1]|uniref:DUF1835 domain-containing protein n=1 Tax=Litoribacterium kuwaitense TaxID=1398745 RepID=UPI0013ECB78E|nr:DUF1835 domain-containing protein [Litoribacterium kuwaitense]NGP46452.1 DUF1835 domain-containing protein [Litoribacterium kuwaitense]
MTDKKTTIDHIREEEPEGKGLHITFGHSASASLNNALSSIRTQQVIGFYDLLSIGPLTNFHEDPTKQHHRYEWLVSHALIDPEDAEQVKEQFNTATSQLKSIPEQSKIFIWTGDNGPEQTGLRYVLDRLRGKPNDVFLINTYQAAKSHLDTRDVEHHFSLTGEMSPDVLRLIYKWNRQDRLLSTNEKERLADEWLALSASQAVLRIWKDQKIHAVEETYYDELIIEMAKSLHTERSNEEYLPAVHLIGHILGHLHEPVGDAFLDYRLKHLIMKGTFDSKGDTKELRDYSVKLRLSE